MRYCFAQHPYLHPFSGSWPQLSPLRLTNALSSEHSDTVKNELMAQAESVSISWDLWDPRAPGTETYRAWMQGECQALLVERSCMKMN